MIYLNDVPRGGATSFPVLNLQVQPKQGMALVFFPATVDGALDKLALHAALPAVDTKYVSQVWIRQSNYYGQPSKRLPQTLSSLTQANPSILYAAQNHHQQQQQQVNHSNPASGAHHHHHHTHTNAMGGGQHHRMVR